MSNKSCIPSPSGVLEEIKSKPSIVVGAEGLMNDLQSMCNIFKKNFEELQDDTDGESMKSKKIIFDSIRNLTNDIITNPAYLSIAVKSMSKEDKEIILMKVEQSQENKRLAKSGKGIM